MNSKLFRQIWKLCVIAPFLTNYGNFTMKCHILCRFEEKKSNIFREISESGSISNALRVVHPISLIFHFYPFVHEHCTLSVCYISLLKRVVMRTFFPRHVVSVGALHACEIGIIRHVSFVTHFSSFFPPHN